MPPSNACRKERKFVGLGTGLWALVLAATISGLLCIVAAGLTLRLTPLHRVPLRSNE
jgi:hypothetical protein